MQRLPVRFSATSIIVGPGQTKCESIEDRQISGDLNGEGLTQLSTYIPGPAAKRELRVLISSRLCGFTSMPVIRLMPRPSL